MERKCVCNCRGNVLILCIKKIMKSYITSFCVLLSLVCGAVINATPSLAVVRDQAKSSVHLKKSFLQYFPGSKWDAQQNIPEQIVDGNIVLRPLRHGDEASEVLVFDLHSKQSNITEYADGRRKTIEESADMFKLLAGRWDQGILYSGFGVFWLSPEGALVPVGMVGVGWSGVDGVGEFFILLKSEHRTKGYGSKIANIMEKWTKFLMDMEVKFGQKSLDTVIATSNVNNTVSQSLLAKAGYLPAMQVDANRFKGTSIILERVEFSVEAAAPSDSWDKEKPLPFSQLGVLSNSKHGTKKALFVFRQKVK